VQCTSAKRRRGKDKLSHCYRPACNSDVKGNHANYTSSNNTSNIVYFSCWATGQCHQTKQWHHLEVHHYFTVSLRFADVPAANKGKARPIAVLLSVYGTQHSTA
jgi:hypothetical protein